MTTEVPALAHTVGRKQIGEITEELRAVRQGLQRRSVDNILACLAGVVDEWLRPDSQWRKAAETALPAATGFSPQMVRYALPFMLEPLRAPALRELLDRELGDRRVLDTFVGGRRALGPPLVVHILSGNLPGLAAVPVVLSLAIKSPVLVKAASGDRVFPALFEDSIRAVDGELGRCVSSCYWRGGDRACEEIAFAAADLVVASGGDAGLADVRSRCPARFIGYGHKISFAYLARESLQNEAERAEVAAALALDVSIWDQCGCLSPQVCFVEGSFEEACRFAACLGDALAEVEKNLPVGVMTLDEQAAVRRFRAEAEWRRLAGKPAAVFASGDAVGWTVAVDPEGGFQPTPLFRSVRLLPVADMAELPSVLAPARRYLEAAGVAAPASRRSAVAEMLAAAGVHRVAPLGCMQRPPLAWLQGGRLRCADWVTWSSRDAE